MSKRTRKAKKLAVTEPSGAIETRKLLILHPEKNDRNAITAEQGYVTGTLDGSDCVSSSALSPIRSLVCGYPPAARKSKLLMAVGYIDESGSEPKSQHCVVAGFVATAEAWEQFSCEWDAVLHQTPPIDYLKMSEAGHCTGQFQRWNDEQRDAKVVALASVIEHAKPLPLIAVVPWADYERIVRGRVIGLVDHPFFVGFHTLIGKMAHAKRRGSYPEVVDFVFDDGSPFADRSLLFYRMLRELAKTVNNTDLLNSLGATPIFRDDKQVLPLQAADMLAWHYRRGLDITLPAERRSAGHVSKFLEILRQLRTEEFDMELGEAELGEYVRCFDRRKNSDDCGR